MENSKVTVHIITVSSLVKSKEINSLDPKDNWKLVAYSKVLQATEQIMRTKVLLSGLNEHRK